MGVNTLHVTLICTNPLTSKEEKLLIPANPYPMYPHVERLNYVAVHSAKGERYVFNQGPTRVASSIIWKSISYEKTKEYETFLLEYAKLGLNPIKIETPKYIDFGKDLGEDIPAAYYTGSANLKDIISLRDEANLFYDIEFPYMFVRE